MTTNINLTEKELRYLLALIAIDFEPGREWEEIAGAVETKLDSALMADFEQQTGA